MNYLSCLTEIRGNFTYLSDGVLKIGDAEFLEEIRVCVCVCLFLVFCHHAHLDPEIIRYVRVHRDTENTFIIVIFAKYAWFRSYGVICLLRMPTTL